MGGRKWRRSVGGLILGACDIAGQYFRVRRGEREDCGESGAIDGRTGGIEEW